MNDGSADRQAAAAQGAELSNAAQQTAAQMAAWTAEQVAVQSRAESRKKVVSHQPQIEK
jgi:hypothetical protein